MAYTFYPGVQISAGSPPGYTGAGIQGNGKTAWENNLDNYWVGHVGAIRMIFHIPSDSWQTARRLVSMMQAKGFYTIATLQPDSNTWNNADLPMATWQTRVRSYVDNVSPDVWSIGNEPGIGSAAATNGLYWPKMKAASDIVRANNSGIPVALAAPIHSDSATFYANANAANVEPYIDMWDAHIYGNTPAATLTAAQNRRAQVDGFTNGWDAKPMIITEFGWSVKAGAGAFSNMVVPPGTAADTTEDTQAGDLYRAFNSFVNNRDALKLRAACWYMAHDAVWMDTQNGWCGLFKDHRTDLPQWPSNPPSVGALEARPAYNRMAFFNTVYDAPAITPPEAVTTGYTNVTQITAGVQGTVDPNGNSTTRHIDWGRSSVVGFENIDVVGTGVGAGTTPVAVGKILSGLQHSTTYKFRVRAVSAIGGTHSGATLTFSTPVPPLPPEVLTGTATNITHEKAILNGLIDANNAAITDYHFEVGTTVPSWLLPSSNLFLSSGTFLGSTVASYGFNTPVGTMAVSDGFSSRSASLTDLLPDTVYHYRLVATSTVGGPIYGEDKIFITSPVPVAETLVPPQLLSQALTVQITSSDGRTFDWDVEFEDVEDQPQEVRFSTGAGDGFAGATVLLHRPIDMDYIDLQLLTRGKFIAADGSVVYEGRVAGAPRSIDDSGERLEVTFEGLMASARDHPFVEIFVDSSTERWGEPSLPLRTAIMNANQVLDADFTATIGEGIHFKGTHGKVISVNSQAIAMYRAPDGALAALFQYRGNRTNAPAAVQNPFLWSTNNDGVAGGLWTTGPIWANGGLSMDANLRTSTITTPSKFLALAARQLTQDSPPTGQAHNARYPEFAVYGDHGITLRGSPANGTTASSPQGLYASDVFTHIVENYCPLLDASEIVPTDFIIPHLLFDVPTDPIEAFQRLNAWHGFLLGVWEGGKVQWEPADLDSPDWTIRSDDPGVQINFHGDTTDDFANGIVVAYQGVDGADHILWPIDHADLRDDNPDNPANREGYAKWTRTELSRPTTFEGALALGAATLFDHNAPKSAAEITITSGWIPDAEGNRLPGSFVRANQLIAITDILNDRPRLITSTDWSAGNLNINVDRPPAQLDAAVARLELGQETAGIG